MGNIKFEHIRNATSKITYKGITFLIDPMLAPKDAYPGFEGTYNNHLRFPLVDLPNSIMEILKDVDAIIVTHTHLDHWDNYAVENIRKDIPIFVQNKKDYNIIKEQGFKDIFILEEEIDFKDIKLIKTGGSHGTVEMYGDTIWTADVNKALNRFKPEIIVMNTGAARARALKEPIIMGKEDVEHMVKAMPNSQIVAVHLDSVNHATVTRKDLREFIKAKNIGKNIIVPEDGEIIKF